MIRHVSAVLLAGVAMLGLSAPAVNAFVPVPKSFAVPSSTAVPAGKRTLPPLGHVMFCVEYPQECRAGSRDRVAPLTESAWHELVSVNSQVNSQIRSKHDSGPYKDVWSISSTTGDCEDYALTKRSRLIGAGWPPLALSVAVVEAPGFGTHAVLVARTDQGAFVLDNLNTTVRPWRAVGYQWAKIQSDTDPHNWMTF